MKRKWFILLISIILILIIILLWPNFRKGDGTNSTCVKVQTTCCPCNRGGEELCVLESESQEYNNKLENCSNNLVCAAFENCKIISCEYENGVCLSHEK